MTSFNHYALGAVADWLHRVVGGLAPASPGYRRIAVAPQPGGGLTRAMSRHRTPYGLAECAWQIEGDRITINATVPPNTTAAVTLPGSDRPTFSVGSGSHRWQYTYRDPYARAPLTLDDTVGAFIDDAAAWAAVTRVVREIVPGLGFVILVLMGQTGVPLRQALAALPRGAELTAAIEQALAK
jgi:alpha-L-rhamnosidase